MQIADTEILPGTIWAVQGDDLKVIWTRVSTNR